MSNQVSSQSPDKMSSKNGLNEYISIPPSSKVYEDTEYEREDYILDQFEDHIEANYKEGKNGKTDNFFSSMIAVLQSSGYGKSKLMERFGSRTPTFYASLQGGSGYPLASFFLNRLIEELDVIISSGIRSVKGSHSFCFANNISTAIYVYILRILYLILSSKKDRDLKLNRYFEVDPEIENHGCFANVPGDDRNEEIFQILFRDLDKVCLYKENIAFDGSNTIQLPEMVKIIGSSSPLLLNKFGILTRNSTSEDSEKELKCSKTATCEEENLTNSLESDVMNLLKNMAKENCSSHLPALFVIDEAHLLLYRSQEAGPNTDKKRYEWQLRDMNWKTRKQFASYSAPYNIFRRVFRMYTNAWEQMILIVISTCGQIRVLLPELEHDPSRRASGSNQPMSNFVLVRTYNVNNAKFTLSIKSNMFVRGEYKNIDGINNWLDFLKSRFRIQHYFKFGRPLIYGYFRQFELKNLYNGEYDPEKKFEDCKEFYSMALKLFGGVRFCHTENDHCLYSMFNFAFGTNFLPAYMKKEDLVENYLMTLVRYLCWIKDGKEYNYIVGGFLPEGVINFIAAKYFVQFPLSLSKVLSCSVMYGLCSVGQFGELLAQYFLLQTTFDCIDEGPEKLYVRKLVFQPVPLNTLLLRLSGDRNLVQVKEFFELNPELDESLVSFGYFSQFPRNPIRRPFDLMARFLFNGSAASLNNQHRGIDLLIPLVLKDGRISFLGVQVKFLKEGHENDTIKKAVGKMRFSNMFGSQRSDRPFGLIILSLSRTVGVLNVFNSKPEGLESSDSANCDPYESPTVFVIQGIPASAKDPKSLLVIAPTDISYHGINSEYFEECDSIRNLIQEIPSSSETEAIPSSSPKSTAGRKRPKRSSRNLSLKSPGRGSEEGSESAATTSSIATRRRGGARRGTL